MVARARTRAKIIAPEKITINDFSPEAHTS